MSKPSFLQFMQERDQLDEAFNSAPYELTMGKKNAGDVFFTFIDEDEKEYRIQFYTPQGLGKNVRQVFIGQKRGSVYPDAIARFKNPMRVIASMIEATKQFLATPLGKTIDGYAVNFSKKALDRGMTLIPKIIRQSGLKQKLNVMDLTYAPVPDRGYVWLVRKGKDPAQVFDGPKMQGITWDDPDKVGDVPVQNNTPDVGASSSVDDSNGWKLTSNGDQPMLIWVGKERGRMVTANIAPHYDVPGMYVGAYMNEKSVRGQSADFIARQLKLPQVPIGVLNDFTKMASKFWSTQAGEVVNSKTLNIPKNALVFGETVNGMSISWSGINFPKSGKYADAIMNMNIIFDYINIKAKFTPMVNQKGRTLNKPISYEIPLKKDMVQSSINRWSEDMDMVARNMQTLVSTNYNPNQVFLNDIYVDDKGAVLWRGHNMGDRRTTEIMLDVIGKETERLEKEPSTAKKTGVDLAAYAGSIRDNAPKGRDLDWQIYASRDGQTLNVDWDITFRRNTTEGAFREFKAQIDRANQYLQTLYQDAKSKGYNPTEPNLMTLARAQQSDEWSASNGESAYSEYEQSLGGNMQIKI
ncbi:hypothetical protein pSal_SNUABM02_188 [Salmonella phage pSal-SNUABM-02]|nr:hypothetical protein pSal_SNUABM02_188 [Salmonella phage pSal-SNUABM-02]